jgi:hypothetical protein
MMGRRVRIITKHDAEKEIMPRMRAKTMGMVLVNMLKTIPVSFVK